MVVQINVTEVIKDLRETGVELDLLATVAIQEFTLALTQFAEFMLGIAQQRAPVKTGLLRASGTTSDPIFQGTTVTVRIGFNTPYAKIQDTGGEIFPRTAKALFIPLRPGVVPIKDKGAQKASGQKQGIDFALVKSVILIGNDYWTDTVEEQELRAAAEVGRVGWANTKKRLAI